MKKGWGAKVIQSINLIKGSFHSGGQKSILGPLTSITGYFKYLRGHFVFKKVSLDGDIADE